MNEVYSYPAYYEIAFSYRDVHQEVDVLDQVIKQHSRIPVTRVLDLACGPAPHLAELVGRGYEYIGLDQSPAMLAYAREKARVIHAPARFVQADMVDFALAEQVDFAFVLLGSLQVGSRADLVSHFDSLGCALKPGGLYLLDWCVRFSPASASTESWEMTAGQITVRTDYRTELVNPVEQLYQDTLTLAVVDQDTSLELEETDLVRAIYPQEFLLMIETRSDFEFVGWWNDWDLAQPLDGTEEISRPITILRRV
jgi:SAM-dependent methyltransferase